MNKRGQVQEDNSFNKESNEINNKDVIDPNDVNKIQSHYNSFFDKLLNTKIIVTLIIIVILIIFSIIALSITFAPKKIPLNNTKNASMPIIEDNKPVINKTEPVNLSLNSTKKYTPPVIRSKSGGGGSGQRFNEPSIPGCAPYLTCQNYSNECKKTMSDGCKNILDCSNNCGIGYECNDSICILVDPIFPDFTLMKDNSMNNTESGIGVFNLTVKNNNGTVFLLFNNINYPATRNNNFYNVSINFTSPINMNYYWWSYGNGTKKNYNYSKVNNYKVWNNITRCKDSDGDLYITGNDDISLCRDYCGTTKNQVCIGNKDCNDLYDIINPGVYEACGNLLDDDCDLQVDEGCLQNNNHPYINISFTERVNKNSPEYVRFKSYVDSQLKGTNNYGFSAYDAILMYKMTGNESYLDYAIKMVENDVVNAESMLANGTKPTIAFDSYLYVGDGISDLSLTYDWGYNRLNDSQKQRWKDYGDKVIWNLWFCHNYNNSCKNDPKWYWSGWSTSNPGNNYYYSFLEATMYYSIATNNQTWVDYLNQRKIPPLINYFKNLSGGGSMEETGYGTSHARLFSDYRFWLDNTKEDLYSKSSHARDTTDYWIHATVPSLDHFAPLGDHARVSDAPLYDYQRHLVLESIQLYINEPQAKRATWWLSNISIFRMSSGFNYKDDLLTKDNSQKIPIETTYYAIAVGNIFSRSSWNKNSSWISFIAGAFTESHAHEDQGSFNFYKNGWLTVDENINTHSGIDQGVDLHNEIRFISNGVTVKQSRTNFGSPIKSSMSYSETNGILNINAILKNAYYNKNNVTYWNRTFIYDKNNEIIRVEDYFATSMDTSAIFQINTPVMPVVQGDGTIIAGNLTIIPIYPINPTINLINWNSIDPNQYYNGWKIELSGSSDKYIVELYANNHEEIIPATVPMIQNSEVGIFTVIMNVVKDIIDGINDFLTPDKKNDDENKNENIVNDKKEESNKDGKKEDNLTDKKEDTINNTKIVENNISINCIDNDKDYYNITIDCGVIDCDDNNNLINHRIVEVCSNSIDDNCNNLIDCKDITCSNDIVCINNVNENKTIIINNTNNTLGAINIDKCDILDQKDSIYRLTTDIVSIDGCFIINADNITLDCNNHEIMYNIDGKKNIYGIYSNKANTNIINCKIKEVKSGSDSGGIYYDNSDFGNIIGNTITGGYFGVYLYWGSDNNNIKDNLINANKYGLYVTSAKNNIITNNHITSNIPFELRDATGNQVINNDLTLNYPYNGFYALSIRSNCRNNYLKDIRINTLTKNNNGMIIWDAYSSSYGNIFENININASGKGLIIDDPKFINATFIGGSIASGDNSISVSSRTNGLLILDGLVYDKNKAIINSTGINIVES